MLQVALWISLGLVLGYAAGYFRGSRETLAAGGTPVATRPAAEPQTPTTGRTAAKETTEQVVTPKSAPAVPLGASPAPATPTTAAPAVKPTTPAAAKPTTAAATPAAKPAPPPRETRPAATTTGRIVVTSTPSKAQVVINGKWTGRTPLTVDDLRFGAYVVRVIEPGYEAVREEFTLSPAAATKTMNVTLGRRAAAPPDVRAPQVPAPAAPSAKPPAAATGDVYVDSRPRGARVFIDGKEVGVTPLTLTGQAVGSHVVRLELADHQSPTVTTEVTAQKTARVTLSLERIK